MKKTISIAFALLWLLPLPVLAASVGATPDRLHVLTPEQGTVQEILTVKNTADTPAIYYLQAEKYGQLITFMPSEFRLEAGDSRSVPVIFSVFPPETLQTNLLLTAQDINGIPQVKAGLKIPVTIQSQTPAEHPWPLHAMIVGLLFVAVTLLILAVWLYSKRSAWSKTTDLMTEKLLSHRPGDLLRHYRKHHVLLVFSILAIIAAIGLLLASILVPLVENRVTPDQDMSRAEQQLRVELVMPNGTITTAIPYQADMTAFSALQQVSDERSMPLAFNPPNEMGVFVTKIGDYENGTDGKYWVFEVNGQEVSVAADKKLVRAGDKVTWKFTVPE